MGLPKRIKGFRERAAEQAAQLQKEYEQSYATKDDRGFAIGSVFDLDLIKELDIEIWRPDMGEHYVDVIPFYAGRQHPHRKEGQLAYKVDFWAHQRIGSMNDFFVCKAQTWKIADPICVYMKAHYIEDKKQYSAIKSSRRCAYFVWVHDNEEQEEKGLQIFEVAHFFFEKKVAEIAKKPRGGGFTDWTNIDTGNHVFWTIGKTGSYEDATGTKRDSIEYTAFQLLERSEPKIPNHILEKSFALDEVIKMHPTDKEINTAFFGSSKAPELEEEAQEEESRLPKKTALERAREKALKAQEEKQVPPAIESEEEPVTEPESDEPEPEPPPKPKLVKPKSSASKSDLVCPAAEVGGQFGVTIEQLDECDDCSIWEACSDANTEMSKTETKPATKLVRR